MSGGAKFPIGAANPGGAVGAVMQLNCPQIAMETNRAGHP